MRHLLPVLLTWTLSQAPGCDVFRLRLGDAYINDDGLADTPVNVTLGARDMPPTQTSLDLAPGKPVLNCAIAWVRPVALDINLQPLSMECNPTGFTVDGLTWEGS